MDHSLTTAMVHSSSSNRNNRKNKSRRQVLRSNRSTNKIVNPLREELLHRSNATCRTDSVSYMNTRAASSRGCPFFLMGGPVRGGGSVDGVHRVHDDVDAKLCIVFRQESLIPKVVVPFAAIVLIAVQHANASVDGDGL